MDRNDSGVSLLCWALVLVLALAACRGQEEDELQGPFGPGQGGAGVPTPMGTLQDQSLLASTGLVTYDDGYFTLTPAPADGVLLSLDNGDYVLDNPGEGAVTLTFVGISGRPDTPCRFQAAVLARDQGYSILASGDRTNSAGLEFHQVNLQNGALSQRFYCTTLSGNLGVLINGVSPAAAALGYEQVHQVLNSVRP